MLEEFLKWLQPEHAEAGRALLVNILSRLEALENAVAPPQEQPAPKAD